VLWLNTPAELLGLSGLIFLMKTVPWCCHGVAIGDGIGSVENIPPDSLLFLSHHQKLGAAMVWATEEEIFVV
jgi:hypothetical protein